MTRSRSRETTVDHTERTMSNKSLSFTDIPGFIPILESPINFIPKETYFKYGIYRSFVSRYKNIHGKMPTQIVFYDEVRRGRSIEEVDRNINPKLKPVD